MKQHFPILWLTGNTGAGKTTLAQGIEQYVNEEIDPARFSHARRLIVLDGDDMRATISTDASLSPADRRLHNLRVARLASHLQSRGFLVVVAVIAPFIAVRKEIDGICAPLWIYVKRTQEKNAEKPYEAPLSPAHTIDNDTLAIAEGQQSLRAFLVGAFMSVTERPREHVRV